MSKYTYDDWLNRVDDIIANKHNFSISEWAKVQAKQKEILGKVIDEEYSILLQKYEEDLVTLDNEIHYRNSMIQELHLLIELCDTSQKPLMPELKELESFYMKIANNIVVQYEVSMPTPEFPDYRESRKVAKAHAYHRFYKYLLTRQDKAKGDNTKGKDGLTTKQQILLIHFLEKIQALKLNIIHQDQTIQAEVLKYLLDRDESNIYTGLNEITKAKHKSRYFTIPNLKAILPIFEKLERPEIVTEIKNEINTAELRSEKI